MADEKPILFTTEMVQAILDGRKTQTRRVIKPQPEDTRAAGKNVRQVRNYFTGVPENGQAYYWRENGTWNSTDPFKCPYRADELWVRETTYIDGYLDWFYKADNTPVASWRDDGGPECKYFEREEACTVPSIHMPRGASRIQLKVQDIRVERVQEISYEDIKAEGVEFDPGMDSRALMNQALYAFQDLWDEINADRGYSWESNPWVWVIEFKII